MKLKNGVLIYTGEKGNKKEIELAINQVVNDEVNIWVKQFKNGERNLSDMLKLDYLAMKLRDNLEKSWVSC